jgi:hypothetical protein
VAQTSTASATVWNEGVKGGQQHSRATMSVKQEHSGAYKRSQRHCLKSEQGGQQGDNVREA